MMAETTDDPGGEDASGGASVRQREHSPMLHLDLYNFECQEAEGSRYVLTSPRSLEACARCMVKPVELLSRSLSDLIREAPGRSMRVATGLCEVYEIERQRKIKMCREERERIIRQEKRRILPLVMSSNLGSPTSSKAPSRAEPSSVVPRRYDSPPNVSTRRSHTQISDSERSRSLPSKSSSKAKPPPSKKQQAPVSKAKKSNVSQSKTCDSGDSGRELSSSVPKKNKSQSLDSLQKMKGSFSGRTSSDSMTSSYSGDSFQGRTTQFIPKSRTLDAVNSLLGRSFSLGDLSHSPQTTKKVEKMVKDVKKKGIQELPSRDKKIAAIMIARHEEENIRNEQRYWAHLQWETQRRTSDLRKEQEEKERQRALYLGQKMLESQIKSRRSRISVGEIKTATLNCEAHLTNQVPGVEKHRCEVPEKEKKKVREKSMTPTEPNTGLMEDKFIIAQQKKQEKAIQQQVNKILQNKMEKIKHQALLQDLSQKEESDNEELKRNLEKNLLKAQENAELLQEKRLKELKSKAQREEMQIQRARQAAERRERERAEHLKELARTAEKKLQHASQIADEVVQHKAKKAVESRLEKEKIQRENRKKVLQNEDLKRQELLLSIEKKLERSQQIFKEKQTVLDNARSVARASFNIREKVRAETNTRTFDKMAREAEFYANIDKK
ncbi:coiled-coil domain-containing protein 177 [Gastrophryne carolinensis]